MAATDGLAAPPQPEPEKQMPTVLCCMCSLPIPPNPTSMCVLCIRTQVDITEGIATNLTIHQCRGCKRYLRPGWVECKLESRELMAVCLRKVRFKRVVSCSGRSGRQAQGKVFGCYS